MEKVEIAATVEAFMKEVKLAMTSGENIYLRGFGTYIVKKRAEKIGRNISKGTPVVIPAHYFPTFKPAKEFAHAVKKSVGKSKKK